MLGLDLKPTDSGFYTLYDSLMQQFQEAQAKLKEIKSYSKEGQEQLITRITNLALILKQFDEDIERERANNMRFSVEDLYRLYGQHDKYIHIEFHRLSESAKKFGPSIGGTLFYTDWDRARLEMEIQKKPHHPRTRGNVRFKVADKHYSLSEDQIRDLQDGKKGFDSHDIHSVTAGNEYPVNAFTTPGEKQIPNVISVPIDTTAVNEYEWSLYFHKLRARSEAPLIQAERHRYCGLLLVLEPEHEYLNTATDLVKNGIATNQDVRLIELECKDSFGLLNSDEEEEFMSLRWQKHDDLQVLIAAELKNNNNDTVEKFSARHPQQYAFLVEQSVYFFESVLVFTNTPIAIYWDFRSFLHIYLRHFNLFQPDGPYKEKTPFRYSFDEIRRILILIIESALPEIVTRLKEGKPFYKNRKTSLYFNGDYYSISIEPSGRVASFSPGKNPYATDKNESDRT